MCRTHIVYQVNNGLLLLAYFRSEASSSAVDLWRYMAGKKWTSLIDKRKSSLLYRRGLFLEWSSPEQEGLTRTWIKIIDFHRNETQRIWGSVSFFPSQIGKGRKWMSVTHLLDANTSFIAFCKEELFFNKKKGRVKRSCCSRIFWRQVRMWMTSQAKLGQVELLRLWKFSTIWYLPLLAYDVYCVVLYDSVKSCLQQLESLGAVE